MFLHMSVILSTGEVSGRPPRQTPTQPVTFLGRHLLGRHPLGRHPQADTTLGRHPPRAGTPQADTPRADTLPPSDGHCSGRYASYWNAFLLVFQMGKLQCTRSKEILSNMAIWFKTQVVLITVA